MRSALKHRFRAFALGSAVVLGASVAAAQQPADSTTRERAAASATPPEPPPEDRTFIDTARDWIKQTQIIERLQGDIDGWYPRFGGITRGSGFAVGPGYRTHVFGGQVYVEASGAFSVRGYKSLDLRARWVQSWNKRAELWTEYHLSDFTQEHFYGIGPASTEATRTSYDLHGSALLVRGEITPLPWLKTGLVAGQWRPRIDRGHEPEFPSIQQLFTDASAPGLDEQPDFLTAEIFVDVDYRDSRGRPTQGGFYRATYGGWDDVTFDRYNFQRFDGTAVQYVPLSANRKHVLSGQLAVSFVNNAPANRVPFYVLPYVGGQDTVRSYREFRFRDENALSFGGEYRWTPIEWVSGVLFADFGKVAHNWQEINLGALKQGYGFGVRVHSKTQMLAALDFGFGGGEGWHTFLKMGASF